MNVKKKITDLRQQIGASCKYVRWGNVLLLLFVLMSLVLLCWAGGFTSANADGKTVEGGVTETSAAESATVEIEAEDTVEPKVTPTEYIFRDGYGSAVDWQAIARAWAESAGLELRYELTDAERWEIASVLTAEADGEPFAGKVAVAQCILQSCEDDDIRPGEALVTYCYSKRRPDPSQEALEAVQAVFDFGYRATTEPIKYFYAPALIQSDWHESQGYVLTINNHKFFKEAD